MQENKEKSVIMEWNPSVSEAGKFMYLHHVYLESKGTETRIVKGEPVAVVKRNYVKKVTDTGNYIKIFVTDDDSLPLSDLSKGALRMLQVIFKLLETDNDVVVFDQVVMEEFGITDSVYYSSLKELIEGKWLYRTKYSNKYYINVLRFFKGSRESLVNKYKALGILV